LDRECGLAWLDPVPVPEEVPRLYASYYTHRTSGEAGGRTPRDLLYGVYRALHSVVAQIVGLAEEMRLMQQAGLGDMQPGRLLDVGCGDGGFLDHMRRKGWTAEGSEVDASAAGIARRRGLTVHLGDLTALDLPSSVYDAITLRHVLEHLPDPRPVFETARRLLRPGGRLVVVTPNIQSLGHQRFGRAWRGLEPPRHFCLYHPDLLRRLAERAGYIVRTCVSSAAHADVILGASLTLQAAAGKPVPDPPPVSILRTVRAVMLQCREHRRIRKGEPCGEECFLVAEKPL
jgi:2-polyprenyl-3-methyl-5-hydroxy-6-metoxy-1,4-benzoquinol methylase